MLRKMIFGGLVAGSSLFGSVGCMGLGGQQGATVGWEWRIYKPGTIQGAPTTSVVTTNSRAPGLTHIGGAAVASALLPEPAQVVTGPTVRAAVSAGLPSGPRFAATGPGLGGDCTCEDLLRELRSINRKLDAQGKPDVTVPRVPMPKAE